MPADCLLRREWHDLTCYMQSQQRRLFANKFRAIQQGVLHVDPEK